ncbi:hypothetical protein BHM03_00062931 [Ensete ventricosum]|nr:hypothetical protein BHM03_00062931 [Ensete ventricosum]
MYVHKPKDTDKLEHLIKHLKMEKSSHLLVLYASQTGNAMDAAERVGREAERGGCPSVQVLPIDRFDAVSKPIISPTHVLI